VIRAIAGVITALISLAAYAQSPSPSLTQEMSRQMRQHIASARERDGQFAAAIAAQEAAWQALALSKTALQLKVTASGSVFYTDRTEQLQGAGDSIDRQRDFVARQLVLAARQPIYRKRDQVSIEQAAARFQEASARVRQAELDLAGRVLLAWVDILAARDLMMLARSMLELAETVLQEMQRRYDAGEISIDQLGLEIARLQRGQADWVESVAKVEIAEKALMDIAGSEALVPPIFSLESAVPSSQSLSAQSEVEELVRTQNFSLEAARFASKAAELEIQKAQSERLPTVEAYASVTAGENDVASYIKNEHRIGVQVVVPLYASGAFDAVAKQAEALLRQSEAQARALENQLQAQAWRAFMTLQVSLIRMDSSRIGRDAAELRVRAVQRGYEAGELSRAEIGRAQSEYQAVRQQSVREKLDYARAWVELGILTASTATSASPSLPTNPLGNLVQR
jgi:outer membrane protein